MSINIPLDKRTTALIAAVSAVIILFPIGYSVVSVALPGPDPFLDIDDPAGKTGEKTGGCVGGRERRYMRFHHMDLLKRVRDEVVRDGAKGEVQLDNCWDCHTSRKGFCNQCHNAVNLQLDCFRCHYDPDLR